MQPRSRVLQAFCAYRGRDAGRGGARAVRVEVLVHLCVSSASDRNVKWETRRVGEGEIRTDGDVVIGVLDRAEHLAVARGRCPRPRPSVRRALDEDELARRTGGAHAVKPGLHEGEDGGGRDVVRLVLEVEDDVRVGRELGGELLPPRLEPGVLDSGERLERRRKRGEGRETYVLVLEIVAPLKIMKLCAASRTHQPSPSLSWFLTPKTKQSSTHGQQQQTRPCP